jgi:hypothetical protein
MLYLNSLIKNRNVQQEVVYHISSSILSIQKILVYCANEIVSCTPALVFVMGAVVAIFGMVLCCWKYNVALIRLLTT